MNFSNGALKKPPQNLYDDEDQNDDMQASSKRQAPLQSSQKRTPHVNPAPAEKPKQKDPSDHSIKKDVQSTGKSHVEGQSSLPSDKTGSKNNSLPADEVKKSAEIGKK